MSSRISPGLFAPNSRINISVSSGIAIIVDVQPIRVLKLRSGACILNFCPNTS